MSSEGAILWQPTAEARERANVTRYLRWLAERRGLRFTSYDELWRWSVRDLDAFWTSIWEFFHVAASGQVTRGMARREMPGAQWFPGTSLNYAEHALRRRDEYTAIVFKAEDRSIQRLTYAELYRETASVAAGLRSLGVETGDRVVGLMPNSPEAVIAFLATASIGAIWSCCAPEFGVSSVADRFRQIDPKVLVAADGYRYGGRAFDRRPAVQALQRELPSLSRTVLVPHLDPAATADGLSNAILWDDLRGDGSDLAFARVPFDHPLWVLYSSGTTGLPKAIVHGHGGILLEQLKALSLHLDLTPDDRFFWFTTTGWMMWNMLVSGLLVGATVLLYDGSPAYPDMNALWRFAHEAGMTYFGTSAPYIQSCRKAGIHPARDFGLGSIRGIGSTGAPLSPEGFDWVYEEVAPDALLASASGGTDVCTAFVLGCPLLPVRAGELQCRGLGAAVAAFNAAGQPVVDEVGELVLTEPIPSMPVRFWNDPDGARYRESYFDVFPGVWRHGDWIRITREGGCVIYGRSDSTLNRAGVRMGTSEFYRVVEEVPEVVDSLVVDTSQLGVEGELLLFVVLREGAVLDDALRQRINTAVARELSPRHVPDEVHAVDQIPRTLNGKKLEVPVKRILAGAPAEHVASPDAMANPESLRFFVDLASRPGAPPS
ncbi:MAG TPA: acetoacetate--CoA ligase [Chloroflexota bacterium]|nr:acetoacetate--CoA ligase [Chloroflexota bacterium]